jgi:hypothetical protein
MHLSGEFDVNVDVDIEGIVALRIRMGGGSMGCSRSMRTSLFKSLSTCWHAAGAEVRFTNHLQHKSGQLVRAAQPLRPQRIAGEDAVEENE